MKKTSVFNKLKTSTKKLTGLTEKSSLLVETETDTVDIGSLRKVTLSQIAKQSNALDHFVEEEGVIFAGKHLIIDLWGASRLDDLQFIKTTLESSINECGATLYVARKKLRCGGCIHVWGRFTNASYLNFKTSISTNINSIGRS